MSLKINNFDIKIDGEKWSIIFNFEIQRAPSEIVPANLPAANLAYWIVLYWAAPTLKGLAEFQNKKF